MMSSNLDERVKAWICKAKGLWSRRVRPSDASVIGDFTGSEIETGEWLVTFRDFEISPEQVRQLSVAYHFLSVERMDYFLLVSCVATSSIDVRQMYRWR
jgi:hypothetical protein